MKNFAEESRLELSTLLLILPQLSLSLCSISAAAHHLKVISISFLLFLGERGEREKMRPENQLVADEKLERGSDYFEFRQREERVGCS